MGGQIGIKSFAERRYPENGLIQLTKDITR